MSEDRRGGIRRIPRLAARAAAMPRFREAHFVWRTGAGRDWLAASLAHEVEQRRLFPWIAVCFGFSIVLFFQADQPALWAPLGALGLCCGIAVLLRRSLFAVSTAVALAAVFAGFSAGIVRTR